MAIEEGGRCTCIASVGQFKAGECYDYYTAAGSVRVVCPDGDLPNLPFARNPYRQFSPLMFQRFFRRGQ
jgi:hypothetical protein